MALRRNILIFHQGALGDFVLTWPVALALARIHPQSRVFYVTHAGKGKLAERVLKIESTDAEAGWHGLFARGGGELAETPTRLLAGAHSVLGFLADADHVWADNVRRIAPEANVLTIDPTPPHGYPAHVTTFQSDQLRPWPAAYAAVEQILRSIHARGIASARPPGATHILIHPGSGSPTKNWPAKRYAELGMRLMEGGMPIDVTIGEVEAERWTPDALAALSAAAVIKRPPTLLGLMDLLGNARAFIGNDSGPAHLAAILGVPTLTLFGPTDPLTWKPLGPRVETVRHEPLETLDVGRVYTAVKSLLT